MFLSLPFLLLLLLLNGCASCTQDPAQAGFFCGVQNISSGTYERRQQALQWQATQAQEQAAYQGRQASALQREEQADISERRALRTQLALLQTNVRRQQRELTRARTESGADQATVARLETQLSQLQDRLKHAQSGTISPEEIAALKRENQELQQKINDVLQRMTTK